jgi:hypothetical protein
MPLLRAPRSHIYHREFQYHTIALVPRWSHYSLESEHVHVVEVNVFFFITLGSRR